MTRPGNNAAVDGSVEFVGCLYRTTAFVVDKLALLLIAAAIGFALFGSRLSEPDALPVVAVVVLLPVHVLYHVLNPWLWATTPGKWLLSSRIVDVRSGGAPTLVQALIRYLGLYLTTLTLGLGFVLATRHPRRQAWHDRLARTVVIGDASLRPLSDQERSESRRPIGQAPWSAERRTDSL